MSLIYLAYWKDATIYVGQTTTDLVRLAKRYGSYTKSKRKTKRLSEMACRLHGHPTFRVLETCSPAMLNEREQYWIGVYSCYPKNLNVTHKVYQPSVMSAEDKAAARMLAEWEEGKQARFEARVLELLAG